MNYGDKLILPAELGGGEGSAMHKLLPETFGNHRWVSLPTVGAVAVPERVLKLAKPPLPPEPGVGTVYRRKDGVVFVRTDENVDHCWYPTVRKNKDNKTGARCVYYSWKEIHS